jgi:hypothetical protein
MDYTRWSRNRHDTPVLYGYEGSISRPPIPFWPEIEVCCAFPFPQEEVPSKQIPSLPSVWRSSP